MSSTTFVRKSTVQHNISPLHFNSHFPGEPWLVSFIGAKDDGGGGGNLSYKTCKVPVISSPPTFYRPDAFPVAQPTALKY